MAKMLLFICLFLGRTIVIAQSSNDMLAVIRNDSLLVYDTQTELYTFKKKLPENGFWRFYRTEFDGHSTTISLYGTYGEMKLIFSNKDYEVTVEIDSINCLSSHFLLGPYYADDYGNIIKKSEDNTSVFLFSRTNRTSHTSNKYLPERLYTDTVPLINSTIPRNCWEEYCVCDVSADGTTILALYGIVVGKHYRIKPIPCEINVITKTITKVEGIFGLNAKYSPSGNWFLYWHNWMFGTDISDGFYIYDRIKNENTYLRGVSDAIWISRNSNIINSTKFQRYMY